MNININNMTSNSKFSYTILNSIYEFTYKDFYILLEFYESVINRPLLTMTLNFPTLSNKVC